MNAKKLTARLDISAKRHIILEKGLIMSQRFLILILSLILTNPVYAHEFWISPVKYEIGINEPIEAHNRVGQNFVGGSYYFLEMQTKRHEVMQAGKKIKVTGRNGDRPAFQLEGLPNGLAILVHETTNMRLLYNDYDSCNKEMYTKSNLHQEAWRLPNQQAMSRLKPRDAGDG